MCIYCTCTYIDSHVHVHIHIHMYIHRFYEATHNGSQPLSIDEGLQLTLIISYIFLFLPLQSFNVNIVGYTFKIGTKFI